MRGKVENGLEMTVFHLAVCVIPNKSVTFAAGMAFPPAFCRTPLPQALPLVFHPQEWP